ncbi:hypothetical protein CEP54_005515 [Fusarium duplospermum]|uniref:Integral membrane protein n=1 Tax=Fusarium duplospermum TaxID=1325734 RepID=A0A428QCJ1_9HYPO|nr:hypothetical protein CEP54_005515 [Fusarium duplospermum]
MSNQPQYNYYPPPPGQEAGQPPQPAQYVPQQHPVGYGQPYQPSPYGQTSAPGQQLGQPPQPAPYSPQQHPGVPGQPLAYGQTPYGQAPAPTPGAPQSTGPVFSAPPSTPAAIQSTAKSFYKVGKGLLGDLASNIKNKYPGGTPGAPSSASTTSAPPSASTYSAPHPVATYQQHHSQGSVQHAQTFPLQHGHEQGHASAPPQPQAYNPPTKKPSRTYHHPPTPPGQHTSLPGSTQVLPVTQQSYNPGPTYATGPLVQSPPDTSSPYQHLQHHNSFPFPHGATVQSPVQSPPGAVPDQGHVAGQSPHAGQPYQPSYTAPPTQYASPTPIHPSPSAPPQYQQPPVPQQSGYTSPGQPVVQSPVTTSSPHAVPPYGQPTAAQQPAQPVYQPQSPAYQVPPVGLASPTDQGHPHAPYNPQAMPPPPVPGMPQQVTPTAPGHHAQASVSQVVPHDAQYPPQAIPPPYQSPAPLPQQTPTALAQEASPHPPPAPQPAVPSPAHNHYYSVHQDPTAQVQAQTQTTVPAQHTSPAADQHQYYSPPPHGGPPGPGPVLGAPGTIPATMAEPNSQVYSAPVYDPASQTPQTPSSQPTHQASPTASQHQYYPPPPPGNGVPVPEQAGNTQHVVQGTPAPNYYSPPPPPVGGYHPGAVSTLTPSDPVPAPAPPTDFGATSPQSVQPIPQVAPSQNHEHEQHFQPIPRPPPQAIENRQEHEQYFQPVPRPAPQPIENRHEHEQHFQPVPRPAPQAIENRQEHEQYFQPVPRPQPEALASRTEHEQYFAPVPRPPIPSTESAAPTTTVPGSTAPAGQYYAPPPGQPSYVQPGAGVPPAPQYAPQQDPVAALSNQMNTLNVQGGQQYPAAQYGGHVQELPRGPPPYQATGPDWQVMPYCPENRVVGYSLDWYRLPDIPEFFVCTRCHADHIAATHLASQFERAEQPDGSASSCGFYVPRVKEVLWPQTLQSNDLTALRAYMKKRPEVLTCKGQAQVTGAEGFKWFQMAQNEVNGFVTCEACYEDHVVGTPFERQFSPSRPHPQEEKWTCDMAILYVQKMVTQTAKQNDWQGFVAAAKKRLELPACEGEVVEANSRTWYLPHRKIKDMYVCEACYLDKLALTKFKGEFEPYQRPAGFDGFMAQLGERWICDLANNKISIQFALEGAIYQRNFDVLWNAANAILNLVPCTKHGIIRGKWWTVTGGCPDLNICEACYNAILIPTGVGHFFEQAERDQTIDIVCNFCPSGSRFGPFLLKFAEAIDKGVFSHYSDYVKKWAGVPVCPGIKHREKGRWWGYGEALFCPDCYLGFVADTPLANSLPVKDVYDERALVCQIWSPRMRKMWLEVCAAGPPGSPESEAALNEFRAFGTKRMQVYNATVPQIEFIQGMKMLKMQNAMHQGQLSLMYQGMNSMAAISGTTDGYLHGNSSLGYYETEHGATAAQMMNNMHSGMADANNGGDWMQIARLQAMWMEVE